MTHFTSSQELVLHFRDQHPRILPVQTIDVQHTSIRVLEFLPEKESLLIRFTHSLLNAQLDLRGVSPYVILHFDRDNRFVGASLSLNAAQGSFGIITQGAQALVLPFDQSLSLHSISHFELPNPSNGLNP
jgi:hypothetical protein